MNKFSFTWNIIKVCINYIIIEVNLYQIYCFKAFNDRSISSVEDVVYLQIAIV